MRIKNFLFVIFAVCLASFVTCQNDTTIDPPDTTTESTTTTTLETTTSEETTTSSTPETTTTVETTTSTTTTTTTTTTTVAPTTTTAASETILSFTLPKNSSQPTCLRANFTLSFDIGYPALKNGTQSNETVHVAVNSINDYNGECTDNYDSLVIDFKSGWSFFLNYTLEKNAYKLSTVRLAYIVNAETFPDVDQDYIGPKTVERSDLNEFAANKGNSYKCTSESKVALDRVDVDFKNYQAQPFISADSKTQDFDTAIECAADTSGTSKLVPIIVGSALALLVILVLVAYIIGRRKHRPGYQQV